MRKCTKTIVTISCALSPGMNTQVDSYSAFWDNGDTSHTLLYSLLVKQGVTDVVVCGLATDYCVGFTALDAARHGFRTVVVEDAVRGMEIGRFWSVFRSPRVQSYLLCMLLVQAKRTSFKFVCVLFFLFRNCTSNNLVMPITPTSQLPQFSITPTSQLP